YSRLNRQTGAIDVYARKLVVDEVANPEVEITLDEAREIDSAAEIGGEVVISKPSPPLGRIAAQAAKQVIYQKVKEAERENIHSEYSDRIGELVNGIVKRFERGDLVVDLGKTEAVLPRRGAVPRRALQPGRSHPDRDRRRGQDGQGSAGDGLAHRCPAADEAVRDGSAGNLRWDRRHHVGGPGSGRPGEDRRPIEGPGRGPG